MATKYYVEGESSSKGHRMSADMAGDSMLAVASAFAFEHPEARIIRVWSSFNSATEAARRLHSPAEPLATFRVNLDPGDEGSFRIHRLEDPA